MENEDAPRITIPPLTDAEIAEMKPGRVMELTPITYKTSLDRILGVPRITQSDHALREERAFPPSKNRSARIRKKLIKRHGYEVRMVPSAIKIDDNIIMHPKLYAEMVRQVQWRIDRKAMEILLGRTPQ